MNFVKYLQTYLMYLCLIFMMINKVRLQYLVLHQIVRILRWLMTIQSALKHSTRIRALDCSLTVSAICLKTTSFLWNNSLTAS